VSEQRSTVLVRLVGVGAGLLAGWLAQRLLDSVWERASGHTPPTADDPEAPLVEVAAAVALTGALVAIARVVASRSTTRLAASRLAR